VLLKRYAPGAKVAGRNFSKSHAGTSPVKLFLRRFRAARFGMVPMLGGMVPVITFGNSALPSAPPMYRYVSALIPEMESGMVPFRPSTAFRPTMCPAVSVPLPPSPQSA
jgi:hypothetical protein